MGPVKRKDGSLVSLYGLNPSSYVVHDLHSPGRTYIETNCYTDIIVELLHAGGYEPLALMGCTLRLDFEGDQWTFFKPAPADLELLYGIDIHEMQPYRPLPEQAAEQILNGRTLIVELDSWYLPDTASTSYRTEHVKSSVAVEAIDREAERMSYFHGPSLYELAGEDYRGVWRVGASLPGDVLPPYTELVRFDAGPALEGEDLRRTARALMAEHLSRRPASNPFERFGTSLERELPRLLQGDAADYHAYAFATVRMAGSAFEAAASMTAWLLQDEAAESALLQIVEGCKALSFRLARRREFDPGPTVERLASSWDEAVTRLDACLA